MAGKGHRRSRQPERAGIAFRRTSTSTIPGRILDVEAVEARARCGRCSRPSLPTSTGAHGRRRPGRGAARPARARKARAWPTRGRGACDRLRHGRVSPLGQRRAHHGRRRVRARVPHDPRERKQARARARAGSGRPARADRQPDRGGSLRPVTDHAPSSCTSSPTSTGRPRPASCWRSRRSFPTWRSRRCAIRVESVDDLALAVARPRRPAVMVYTLVEPGLRDGMRRLCTDARACTTATSWVTRSTRSRASRRRGADGAGRASTGSTRRTSSGSRRSSSPCATTTAWAAGWTRPDIVLVGVSRTSKTPLSIYLGYLGHKAANVPIVRVSSRRRTCSRSTARRSSG